MIYVALAGCAHIHTPGFIQMLNSRADVKVKSVWDHDSARARKRAEEARAEFADLDAILDDPQIQAVFVCSETDRHEDLVRRITSTRKHLFVEKPLGIGSRDAVVMADLIEQSGAIFQTGYMNRGIPAIRFIREHVNRGSFGKITRARYSLCHSGALGGWFDIEWRWMADPKQAGVGAFGDLGTHGLDILIWLFGEVDRVAATLDSGTGRYPDCDETGEAMLVFKSGVIATLAAAWDDVSDPVPLSVSGTQMHAAIINEQVFVRSDQLPGADGKTPYPPERLPKHLPHAFELFLDALAGRDAPLVTPCEAAYRSVVMEAIYHANQTQSWINLK